MELFFILLLYLLFAVKCLDISFLLFRGPLPFSLSDLRRGDTLGTAGGVLSYSLTPSHMQTWSCPLLPGPALTTSLGQGPFGPSTIPDSPSCAAPGPQPVPSPPRGSATVRVLERAAVCTAPCHLQLWDTDDVLLPSLRNPAVSC